jgi:hypothetical protein
MFAWNKIEFSYLNGNLVVLTIRLLTLNSEAVALADADRHPAWPSRNEFIHEVFRKFIGRTPTEYRRHRQDWPHWYGTATTAASKGCSPTAPHSGTNASGAPT